MPWKPWRKSPRSESASCAGEARERLRHEAAAELGEPEPELARAERGREERARRVVAQEVEDAVGRVEEVERVGGRRRVEDDEVVVAVGGELVELLHRHVLLRAGQRGRTSAGRAGSPGCGRAAPGRARGASTRSSQVRFTSSIIAKSSPSRREPRRGEGLRSGTRVSTLPSDGEAERVGEAAGRVDGADQRAAARERAGERDGRGDRGLARRRRSRRRRRSAGSPRLAHGGHGASSGAVRRRSRRRSARPRPRPQSATGSSGSTVVGRSSAARSAREVALRLLGAERLEASGPARPGPSGRRRGGEALERAPPPPA